MKTKNETVATVAAEQNQVSNQVKSAAEQQTQEAAQSVSELEKSIAEQQKQLQAKLAELKHKQELSEHRTMFIDTLARLDEVENKLSDGDSLEVTNYKLIFQDLGTGYRQDNIFSIGNRFILLQFTRFISEEIKKKVVVIEQELLK